MPMAGCHKSRGKYIITGENKIGGIVGEILEISDVISCVANGKVKGTESVGGICGYVEPYVYSQVDMVTNICKCHNIAGIYGNNNIGGIIGKTLTKSAYKGHYQNSSGKWVLDWKSPKNVCVSDCYNNGTITCESGSTGGIVGYTYADSYPSGHATILKNCYNSGSVVTTVSTNGPISGNSSSITHTYYLKGCISESNNGYGTEKTVNQMKTQSSFEDWDFDTVWTMAGDENYKYPELQCFTLRGDLSFEGDIAYKGTVTPNISAIENAYSELTYDWYIDNEKVYTGNSYTFSENDIGKTVKLKATSSHPMSLGGIWSEVKVVSKAPQPETPTTPTLTDKTDYSFEIITVNTQEYSIDNENWQTDGKFENLDPNKEYTVYSRILENDLYLLGDSTEVLKVTTDRRAITGNAGILGTTQYGQKITADISGILPTDATLTYEWKVSGNTVGTESSYTITESDIGKGITLVIKGSGDYTGILSSAPVSAIKAMSQKPNVPEISNITNTTVTLIKKSGCEYSLDKLNWQDSPIFDGLNVATKYEFYQRIKETNTTFASDCSDAITVTTLKNTVNTPQKPTAETVTNTSITLVLINGYEYSMDGVVWQKSNIFGNLIPNTEYAFYQRKSETDVDYASAKSEVALITTLKNSVSTPVAPTIEKATDSSVTLTAISGYEYSKDGKIWQKSNVFGDLTVLTTYNFYQRVAETNSDYASNSSAAVSFKVKNIASKAEIPVLKARTNNTIEIEKIVGYEYSIDGQNWTVNNVFENLNPNTDYYVYARKLETDTHYASEMSDKLKITTLKNTISAPAQPVLSNRTSNSITLAFDGTYEYSVDGTVWQTSNTFYNLLPNTEYTFYQRKAETQTAYASEKSAGLKVYTLKKTVSAPGVPTISEETPTSITLVKISGYEYSKDGKTWQSSNVFGNLIPNTKYTFYQRAAETDTAYASEKSVALAVTTPKKSAATAKAVSSVRVTPTSVTLAPYTGYEYSINGNDWQASNEFTGLTANTTYKFYQRIAETEDTAASKASPACDVKTSAKSACSVSAVKPIVTETTADKVVLLVKDGYEYSKNGTSWQKSNVFGGLSSNTAYTFYQRVAETDSELAGNKSEGLKVTTRKASTPVTSATNYEKLRNYIFTYGAKDENEQGEIVEKVTSTSGSMTVYYSLENTDSGIVFSILEASGTKATQMMLGTVSFTLSKDSKLLPTETIWAYYYKNSLCGKANKTLNIDRSTHLESKTYNLYNDSDFFPSEDLTKLFNDSLKLLCAYWDLHIYKNLGFGLKGLGFISYSSGLGSTVCDLPSSYHTGSEENRNAYAATCTTDGYTGDTYCTACGEKLSSGSVIKCSGSHKYSDSCDKDCNVCGEERVIEHTYSNACDTTCNICGHTREAAKHTYDNDCDEICNVCSEKRKAPHVYDNSEDLICNNCGYERPPYIPGDLDGDDEITDADAIYLLMHTFFPEDYPVNQECDFNGDGIVNDADSEYLLMYTFFPEEYPLN